MGELLPSFESLEGKDCYFPIFASSKMHCLAAEFFGKADFILRPQIFGAISSISRMKSKLARAGFPLTQGEHVSAHSKRWPQNVTTLWKRFGKSFCYSRVVPVFFKVTILFEHIVDYFWNKRRRQCRLPVLSFKYKFLRTVVCSVSNLSVKLLEARTPDLFSQTNSSDRQIHTAAGAWQLMDTQQKLRSSLLESGTEGWF